MPSAVHGRSHHALGRRDYRGPEGSEKEILLHSDNPRFCSEGLRSLLWSLRMFDVYLSNKHDLLVVRRGLPVPLNGRPGKWRKSKKVIRVSNEIASAVERQGYYMRKLRTVTKR